MSTLEQLAADAGWTGPPIVLVEEVDDSGEPRLIARHAKPTEGATYAGRHTR